MNEVITENIKTVLIELGLNPDEAGLKDTPARVAQSLGELTNGYNKDPAEAIGGALFPVHPDSFPGIVAVKNIAFHSLCEHHLLPFYGTVDVGYIPHRVVVGLSKIPRLVGIYARRLQMQERMTQQIAHSLRENIPGVEDVIVRVKATHFCMQMRGIETPNSETTTVVYEGDFCNESRRSEFYGM